MAKLGAKNEILELEIPEKGGPFVLISKQYILELKTAFQAIIEGEEALRTKKTRSFRDFLKKDFPAYAKNF